jgi:hypothetical protein
LVFLGKLFQGGGGGLIGVARNIVTGAT